MWTAIKCIFLWIALMVSGMMLQNKRLKNKFLKWLNIRKKKFSKTLKRWYLGKNKIESKKKMEIKVNKFHLMKKMNKKKKRRKNIQEK